MIVRIGSEAMESIDLNPATAAAETAQNVMALTLTPEGSCPLLRQMGLPMRFQDRPSEVAAEICEAELNMEMNLWEPRASLTRVTGRTDEKTGWMVEYLEVEINA